MSKLPIAVFAAKSKDENLRRVSTSGGVFTELARVVFARGGVVVGAGWKSEPFRVAHKVAHCEGEIEDMRGAKYAPSDMSCVYGDVRQALDSGKTVLFTGTPCQVAAVRKHFGACENLILCAIICHSIPDPRVWARYVEDLEREARSRIVRMAFRDKGCDDGWHDGRMVVEFEDGRRRIVEKLRDNVFIKAFFYGFSTRKSCEGCQFRNGLHGADLMIGDFWGIENCHPQFDDGFGVSAVLVYTSRGQDLLRETGLDVISSTYEQVLAKNPNVEKRVSLDSPGRSRFLSAYQRIGVERAFWLAKDGPWYRRAVVRIYRMLRYGSEVA